MIEGSDSGGRRQWDDGRYDRGGTGVIISVKIRRTGKCTQAPSRLERAETAVCRDFDEKR